MFTHTGFPNLAQMKVSLIWNPLFYTFDYCCHLIYPQMQQSLILEAQTALLSTQIRERLGSAK